MSLNADQVDFYREHGYLVLPGLLSGETLQRLRQAVDGLLEGATRVESNTELYDLEDSHTPQHPRVRRLKAPHRHDPAFAELIRDELLLAPLRALLGPAIRLQGVKLNLKSAGYGAAVEWHQDWAFYPYTNDDVLAVGVMLDAFVSDNGPMMVIPGSHRGPIHDHTGNGVFCGAIDLTRDALPLERAVPLLGPAGSVSLHHARLIHGSALNTSGRPRNFLLYEVAAGDAWPLAGGFAPYTDHAEFESRRLCGDPCLQPRMTAVPLRMPLPRPPDPSSLYQAQKNLAHRFFEVAN
jgi:ectoine hydroxylase